MLLKRAKKNGLRGVCGLVVMTGIAASMNFGHCFGQSTKPSAPQNAPTEETSKEDEESEEQSVEAGAAVAQAPAAVVAAPQVAPQPTPMPQPTYSPPMQNWTQEDPLWITSRYTLRRDFGNGVGYQSGFTYLEGFIPILQTPGDSIAFMNVRGVNYDASELWEGQLGMGIRQMTDSGVVVGLNAFYDGRNTNMRYYNQAGLGWEALGAVWEARGNVYIPMGSQSARSQTVGAAVNPQFVNQNIQIDRLLNNQVESAMNGCDVELGRQLPSRRENVRTSAYMGYYHYSNTGMRAANGIRVRAESWFQENVSANFSLQNDAVFKTTVTGGVSLHYGGVPNGSRRANPLAAKLGSRVVRDPNIVISTQQSTSTTQELLTDPVSGDPIVVVHASSTAAAGGDGSVETPYDTLAAMQAGSSAGNILFLHAGSTFSQSSLTLKNDQRLLGEGIDHFVTATQGTFLMPRATALTAAPIMLRTSGATNAINLASNNEVSGLAYQRTGGTGGFIGGTGSIGDFNINRNTTTGGLFAVGFANVSGDGVISDNAFGAHTVNAISAVQTSNALRLLIEDNTFTGGTAGVVLTQTGGTQVFGIRDNTFSSAVSVTDTVIGGTQTLLLSDNTGTGGFVLTRIGGTFRAEDTLGTNSPAPTTVGTITIVPAGTAGF